MSKVKYPEADIINQQIIQILDRSGLFKNESEPLVEPIDDNRKYVKCVPVHEKKAMVGMKYVAGAFAAAAIIMIAVTVGNYVPVKHSAPQPLNAVPEDTTNITNVVGDKVEVRNPEIEALSMDQTTETCFDWFDGIQETNVAQKMKYGTLTRSKVSVKYQGNEVSAVTALADQQVNALKNESKNLYVKYYRLETASGIEMNDTQNVLDAGLNNQNIISLKESTTIKCNNLQYDYYTSYNKGYCIDVAENKVLQFADLFSDTSMGYNEVKDLVYKEILKYDKTINEVGIQDLIEKSMVDGNWYISDGKLSFIMAYGKTQLGEDFQSSVFKEFSISISDLKYLKSDYQ